MTKTIAKWLALALCAALTLSGCGLISVNKTNNGGTVQQSAAGSPQVVAEYDGGTVGYDEALQEYQLWKSSYEAYGYQLTEESDIQQLKQQVLDSLVQDRIVQAKAKSMGLTELTDADKKSIEDQANAEYEDMISYYSDYLQGDTDQETRQNAIDYLNSIGYTLDSIKQYDTETAWQDELKNQITKDVTVTDDQVKAAYDASVKEDEQSFTEDTYNFENAATYGDTITWVPEGYRAVKHILLPLADEDASQLSDLQSQIEDVNVRISELENPEATESPEEGDIAADAATDAATDAAVSADAAATSAPDVASVPDVTAAPDVETVPDATAAPDDTAVAASPEPTVAADDAAVSPDDATGDEDFTDDEAFSEDDSADAANDEAAAQDDAALENLTLPELQAKLTGLQQQLDSLKTTVMAKMQPKVDEIQQKIAAGEDFDKLIEEYGQDDGMKTDPTKTNGYYVSQNSQMWDDEFTTAAMALQKVGDVSGPVLSQSGVHLIKYIQDVTPGAVPLEKVQNEIRDETLDQAKNDLYDKTVQGWVADAHAKTYVDRLVDPAPTAQPEATPSASN